MTAHLRTIAAGLALATVVGMLSHRAAALANVPGRPDAEHWALQDFRDAVYYPVVAWLDGRNPYDREAQARAYPVGQSFPLYLPLTLVVHLPFGLLPHAEAQALYFAVTVVLTGVLAALAIAGAGISVTLAGVLGLTAALLLSRPGQMNLLLGQVTATVAIGAYVALRWARTRPLLAGLGLALATLKPTYGVPLAALMLLGRGDVAAVLVGAAAASVACLVAFVPLVHASGGAASFVASLGSSAAAFAADRTSNSWSSFARLDVTALAARFLGRVPEPSIEFALGLTLVSVAIVGLRRLRPDETEPSSHLGLGLICLTVLVAVYHQTYDALLLTQPAVALGAGRWGRSIVAPVGVRWALLGLFAVPALNYLASNTVASRLTEGSPAWLAITAANPVAILAAWAVHIRWAWRPAAP